MNDYYFEALDAEDEPTIWIRTDHEPIAILRRCELTEIGRTVWDRIAEAVCS